MMYEVIKYCDIFGTKFSFYTDEKPRFYTFLGGISSILVVIICIIVFIFYSLDDFQRNTPTVTNSLILSQGNIKIKLGQEKIWIPWRIADYDNKYINHENLIYPIFTYYSGVRNDTNSNFNYKTKKLNYKLCNETSMKNKPDFYKINVPLNLLYCTDMDDLEIGGSWNSLFINYIQMDFYLCENGIDYNETNKKCTTQQDIIKRIGYNNSLQIEYYYPNIQFQPTNISHPIIIGYNQEYYFISKFTSKIDRLYLRKHLLKDDLGWIKKNSITSSYCGFNELNGDSYTITNERDLMSEGSTSRIYSLNIYLQPGIVYYERKYKKIIQIIIEGLPIMFVVLRIFKKIVKTIKYSEENKKLFELLFENIKEKKNKFEQFRRNIIMEKQNKIEEAKIKTDNQLENPSFNPNPNNPNTINSSYKDGSKVALSPKIDYSIKIFNENKTESRNQNNIKRKKLIENNQKLNLLNNSLSKEMKEDASINKIEHIFNNNYQISKLFPYRYYFFSIFIKNFDIAKLMSCFSKKFVKVYKFLGRMFDISSFLSAQREFQILKNIILEVKDIYRIENPKKINVNEEKFIRNMNECLNNRSFNIFYQNASKKIK